MAGGRGRREKAPLSFPDSDITDGARKKRKRKERKKEERRGREGLSRGEGGRADVSRKHICQLR